MYVLISLMDDVNEIDSQTVQLNATQEDFDTVCNAVGNNMKLPDKIIVEVRGGVAYCDDERVEIIDHDNR